jgi:hypothetical protein
MTDALVRRGKFRHRKKTASGKQRQKLELCHYQPIMPGANRSCKRAREGFSLRPLREHSLPTS